MAQITLRDYLQKTEDAISSSRVDDALTYCQLMLSYFPEALEIQRLLGEVYLAQERLEEAQRVFDWVLTNDPENVLAYCNRADVSERISEYDTALDCYQQAYELSRGNTQIRQEFNRLSEKVGQKGFMFSRAGLARLYMRGDLLSQAMLEWDAVLMSTPDRLDARTGQLETYWRLGQLESADQLAEHILLDVPGCLKALLLQANIIFRQNSQHAQELLRRAQALDPDFVQAQELFADALAKQPDDPFLQQLKKAPVLFSSEAKGIAATIPHSEQQPASFAPTSDTVNAFGNKGIADGLATWGSDANWNSDTTLVKPQADTISAFSQNGLSSSWDLGGMHMVDTVHNGSSLSGTSLPISNGTASQSGWNVQSQEIENTTASQSGSIESKESAPEPWELLQNALNQFGTNGSTNLYEDSLPLWENLPVSAESNQTNLDASPASWLMPNEQEKSNVAGFGSDIWGAPTGEVSPFAEGNAPIPPTWLNMLSETNRTSPGSDLSTFGLEPQHNGDQSFASALFEQPEAAQQHSPALKDHDAESSLFQSMPFTHSVENAAPQSFELQSTEIEGAEENNYTEKADEESFFGPAWLKSLGATTLTDDEAPANVSQAGAETQDAESQEYTHPDYRENYNTPIAQQNENFVQTPATDYEKKQQAGQTPSTSPSRESEPTINPYESWLQGQEGLNNSPNIHERTAWATTPTDQSQPSQNREYENWPAHEEMYASGMQSTLSSMGQPKEQAMQPEIAQENIEQNLVTTLEELEQSLRSKGFIPLEPKSLATVASKVQENIPSYDAPDATRMQKEFDAHNLQQSEFEQEVQDVQDVQNEQDTEDTFRSSSLSSALAQLGSFTKQPTPPPAIPSFSTSFEGIGQTEEPSWLQALKNSPVIANVPDTASEPAAQADAPSTQTEQSEQYQQLQDVFSHFQPTPTLLPQTGGQEPDTYNPPSTPPVYMETGTANFNDTKKPVAKELQETVKVSALRRHPLLDGGLETTMKRPAVRLQPMQHQATPVVSVPGGAHIVSRTQSGERIEKAANRVRKAPTENLNLSYHDRLLKGYQHQLVGDYDEAMQEYRLIIRNATDLLGEVVSNVRALLKLAPNYAAGYRVLGDAYMRQGEYLQAMESYNRALSMTKKVK